MVNNAKREFIEYLIELNKSKGLDTLSSKIIAHLYIEPKELSLEKIANTIGYSLSAVSTSLKLLERFRVVTRIKKPGSKKVYYFMDKDILGSFMRSFKEHYDRLIPLSKKRLPEIIQKYKKDKVNKEELKIIENCYKQLLSFEKILSKLNKMIENETYNRSN